MYLYEISRKQLYRVHVQTAQTEGTLHFRGFEDYQVSLLHGERALQLPVKYTRDFFFYICALLIYVSTVFFTNSYQIMK
jgi:hypothetical protein